MVKGGFGIFYDALPAFIGDSFMTNMPNEVQERLGYAYGATVGWADPTTQSTAAQCAGLLQSGFGSGISWGHGADSA